MMEIPLTLAAWLVSGKSFCVKKLQKMLLTLLQILDEKADSACHESAWKKCANQS